MEKLLKKGLEELGYIPDPEQLHAFKVYLSELKRWNRVYNLTGLRTDEEIIIKHFLDSALYLKVIPTEKITIADIGSGAGFPGIPIKIIRPEIEINLVEPSVKKSAFLDHIIRTLNLSAIRVIEKRVEEIRVPQEGIPVDIAVSRALFSVKAFIKKASRIVKAGGRLVLSKGPKVAGELAEIKDVASEIIIQKLPFVAVERFFVLIQLE